MSDGSQDPPPRLFTPLYWVALGFGLAMILAGVMVDLFGARWLAAPPPRSPPVRALTAHQVRGKEPTDSPGVHPPKIN